jgi:hypothetical protein
VMQMLIRWMVMTWMAEAVARALEKRGSSAAKYGRLAGTKDWETTIILASIP